ncbi:Phosphatidylinositol-4-phosphate 5-kinase [Physocladia obscura]|uniref:Phosphatidylinositol-4-phosphate 5-kinase n=1 Tax=Physocladia obscura TaxID=109957 RepID=A0AAD5SSL3_9FUNG|nr:Phosphatidylinositol-4-phosphate 5-kinase [Physocladia obscura]
MGNVNPANKDIHETYDLKGSTVGRYVKPEDVKPYSTLKDLNFLERGRKIQLGPRKKEIFLQQLERDVLFLQMMNIMDYSLLFGVHNLETGNRENIRDATLAAFEPTPETLVRRQPTELSGPITGGAGAGTGGVGVGGVATLRKSRPRSRSRDRDRTINDTVVEPSRAILPDDSPPERLYFTFYHEMGGILAVDEDGEDVGEVYYLGIIDLFTEYNVTKKLEHFVKSLLGNGRKISAVNAVQYGKRFIAFIEKACI